MSKSRDELLAELADLQAKNEAATSWGAAIGARHERIKEIQSTLRSPPATGPDVCPSCKAATRHWWSYCAMCGYHIAGGALSVARPNRGGAA